VRLQAGLPYTQPGVQDARLNNGGHGVTALPWHLQRASCSDCGGHGVTGLPLDPRAYAWGCYSAITA